MFDARDRKYMRAALALAEKNLGLSSPNPSVGCVVVRSDRIVGRGWHEYDRRDHAEVMALNQASEQSRNATVYVTLEPCSHQGRTPPCAELLIQKGIRRVVIARIDPFPKVSGRGVEILRSAGIKVDIGLMSDRAGEIIESFACFVTTGVPLIVCKAGMSLDGKIGSGTKEGRWITSPESRVYAQDLRLRMDALLVGIDTILSDDPELTYRGSRAKNRPLLRVILDSRLRTPSNARVFDSVSNNPVLIFCKKGAAGSRLRKLEARGSEVIAVAGDENGLDLNAVLEELAKRKVLGLLVEGGSRVHWTFLYRKMVDRFNFIIAPIILGGKSAVPSVGGRGYAATAEAPNFRIRRNFTLGPDVVLETYPSFSRSIISPWRPR